MPEETVVEAAPSVAEPEIEGSSTRPTGYPNP
jgi:hypothetical protein